MGPRSHFFIITTIKESIKLILNSGGTITVPYKRKINDWYGEIKITRMFNDNFCCYEWVIQHPWKVFYDQDEAINYFCYHAFGPSNYGYLQNRLREQGLLESYDDRDFEKPSKKMINLFKSEANKSTELLKNNGIVKPLDNLTKEKAILDFENIIANFNIINSGYDIIDYVKKYSLIEPNVSMYFHYKIKRKGDVNFNDNPYMIRLKEKELSKEKIEELKNYKG